MRLFILILLAITIYACSNPTHEDIKEYYFPLKKIRKQTTYYYKNTITSPKGTFTNNFAIQIKPLENLKYSFVVLDSQNKSTDSTVLEYTDSGIVIKDMYKPINGIMIKEKVEGCLFVHSFNREIGDAC